MNPNIHSAIAVRIRVFTVPVLRGMLLLAPLLVIALFARADDLDPAGERRTRFPGGVPLKTDPELERLVERAEEFAREGRYDLAAVLWQKVLDESGDTLVTRDDRKYTAMSEEVERTIAKLPAEGLRVYRISADGDAQALLAAGGGSERPAALAEIVRRYFLSSLGDDAAYELGCRALDTHDFVGASRMFAKILNDYPDSSIPRAEVLLRAAAAGARLGDREAAEQLLAQAERQRQRPSTLELVRAELGRATGSSVLSSQGWPMRLGNPSFTGHMPALPASATSSALTEAWSAPLESAVVQAAQGGNNPYAFSRRRGGEPVVQAGSEQQLQRWKSSDWFPTSGLLFDGDRVYLKTNHDLACWSRDGAEQLRWRSAWLNAYHPDPITSMMAMIGQQLVQGRPHGPQEVLTFGDQIHRGASIIDGVVYSIEGRRVPRHVGTTASAANPQEGYNWGTVPRRTRSNYLAAYDARTGKSRWEPPVSAGEAGDKEADLGFLAAPVPFGHFLLLPVTDGGSLWLHALHRDDGRPMWKTYLCDEPSGGCSHWSPVGVSVEGGEVYVATGSGVVFALDATSGSIRWAVRYRRDGSTNSQLQNYFGYGGQLLELKGWDEDLAIPHGKALVVIASDHDRIFAIDRRTGELLWDSPRTPLGEAGRYVLGVLGDNLYTGSRNAARGYHIPSGRLLWETVLGTCHGRGALTADGVYMPVGNSIVKLDPADGRKLVQVGVSLTSDEPVGNLFADGEKLWCVGAEQVYALTSLDFRLERLAERIKEGDPQAHFERMRIRGKLEQYEEAVADLRAGFAQLRGGAPESAAEALLAGMETLQLARRNAPLALELLTDSREVFAPLVRGTSDQSRAWQGRRGALLQTALQEAAKTGGEAVVPQLLAVIPLCRDDYDLIAVGRAVSACAGESHASLLARALAEGDAPQRVALAEPISRVLGPASVVILRPLAQDADERVRLAAARGLLNGGERAGLSVLVELLQAEDPRVRGSSIQALRAVSGEKFEYNPYGEEQAREKQAGAWRGWLEEKHETAELTLPLPERDLLLGRTLISFYASNNVIELDAERREVWKATINGPWGAQGLPNGHRLITSYSNRQVFEFDEKGKELWKLENLPGMAFAAQRLPNGNTLVPCSDAERVLEYDHSGKVVWQAEIAGRPMDARRLEDGNTLVALQNGNKVVELDPNGKVVWEAANQQGAITAQRLENGNTLVAQMNAGRVVEIDRAGKEISAITGLSNPYHAQRLPNGHTLVTDNTAVREYDPAGKVVWERSGSGGSAAVRY